MVIVDTLGSLSLQVKQNSTSSHGPCASYNFNSPKDLDDEDADCGQAGEEVDPDIPTSTEIPPAPTTVQPQTLHRTQPNAARSTWAQKPYYPTTLGDIRFRLKEGVW
jgi:hypothetical protein